MTAIKIRNYWCAEHREICKILWWEKKKNNARVPTLDYVYLNLKNQQTNLCDRIQKTYLWDSLGGQWLEHHAFNAGEPAPDLWSGS